MKMDNTEETKPMPIRAVSFDDTSYYQIPEEDMVYIERIVSTYLYRDDECTHLCEITPSFELRWLMTEVWTVPDTSDEVREELSERYETWHGEDIYMHVRDVEHRPTVDCGTYESWDDATEHLQGNPPEQKLPEPKAPETSGT